MKILVQKFGGTSLGSVERIESAAKLIQRASSAGYSVVAVASAMGDTTDELLSLTNGFDLRTARRELDMLLACGEQISSGLLGIALNSAGCRAKVFTGGQAGIITDDRFGSAGIKRVRTDRLLQCLASGNVAVVTGFQGITENGDVTTLGRGGSDTTAVALAGALRADCCDIYTDVDGIYSTDPRMIDSAIKVECMPTRQMLALAEAGARVMATCAMQLAMKQQVPIRVRSVFSPEDTGTLIVPTGRPAPFCGIAIEEQQQIFVADEPDSLLDREALGVVINLLADYGIQTSRVFKPGRKHAKKIVLATSTRHVHDGKTFVPELAKSSGIDLRYRGTLDKLSVIGDFANTSHTIHRVLSVLMRGKVIPFFWGADEGSRVTVMISHEDLRRATQLLHENFLRETMRGSLAA